jgi:protein O-mannosyl-transferase
MAKKTNTKAPARQVPQAAAKPKVVPKPVPKKPEKQITEKKAVTKLPAVWGAAILLAAISIFVYAYTFNHTYVLDDVMMVKDNTLVKQGARAIPELFSTPHMKGYFHIPNDTYRPLSLVLFAMEVQFFGDNPSAMHFFNVLWFAACVVALFLFLHQLFEGKKMAVAFVAAFVFAVHPIHTEVVANIKSRDELLCYFFALTALIAFTNYARKGKPLQLLLGSLLLYLSFISKETVITFLGVVPLVFFFYRNEHRRRSAYITLSMVLITAAYLGIRYFVLKAYDANHNQPLSFVDNSLVKAPNALSRLATEILILGYYLKLMFVPYPLVCDYSFNSIPYTGFGNPLVLLSLVVYLAMGAFAIYRLVKVRRDGWAFAILFYLITISLFSNIPFLVGAAMADRFAFFASTGFCIAVGMGVVTVMMKLPLAADAPLALLKNTRPWFVLAPLAVVFGYMTIARASDWKDNYTLFKTDVEKLPENTRLNYYMGDELQHMYEAEKDPVVKKELNDQSLHYLQRSLQIYADYTDAFVDAGNAYFNEKHYDSAGYYYKKALALNVTNSNANFNLATVYMQQEKYADAIPYYREATVYKSNFVPAWFNLGVCFVKVLQYDSSVKYFEKVIASYPEYSNYKAYEYTAIVFTTMGKNDSAAKYMALAKKFEGGAKN